MLFLHSKKNHYIMFPLHPSLIHTSSPVYLPFQLQIAITGLPSPPTPPSPSRTPKGWVGMLSQKHSLARSLLAPCQQLFDYSTCRFLNNNQYYSSHIIPTLLSFPCTVLSMHPFYIISIVSLSLIIVTV